MASRRTGRVTVALDRVGRSELLGDADLMAAHRLELPFGFDPSSVPLTR
jgi:hypothetical protein